MIVGIASFVLAAPAAPTCDDDPGVEPPVLGGTGSQPPCGRERVDNSPYVRDVRRTSVETPSPIRKRHLAQTQKRHDSGKRS